MNSTLFPEHESLVSELIQLHEVGGYRMRFC